ncbi:MAG: hypothetical protein QOF51_4027 [Chloroflexota bacterium]|jgi:hypothetical protein|nr:hypothetical protein [Chloroflexota bacterium]
MPCRCPSSASSPARRSGHTRREVQNDWSGGAVVPARDSQRSEGVQIVKAGWGSSVDDDDRVGFTHLLQADRHLDLPLHTASYAHVPVPCA